MVISCWPGETFWPGWTDLCPTIPLTGAHNGRVVQIELILL
jgi:hypothetical protein